jgi:predicted RNA-binding protein with PUA-like domain
LYPDAVNYWLLKTEPSTYSWADLVRDKRTFWDGVRNYQARNNLQAMGKGDRALLYHSVGPKEVVGIAEVVREAYPDPTTEDQRWVVVDIKPAKALPSPVTLAAIKETPALGEIALIKQSRLSVLPLKAAEFNLIVKMGGGR